MNAPGAPAGSDQTGDGGLPPAGAYRLDPLHTFAQFSVKHLIVGRVDGRFNSLEGEFALSDDSERPFDRIAVRVDAASVDTKVEARDEDLRSPRFFDVANFPALTFHGRTTARTGESSWTVAGELTIRDVTRPVSFDVILRGTTIDQWGQTKLGATAASALPRPDFDLTTELQQESGDEGGPDVWIRVDVEAILDADQAH
jgi:polyisoprenoid-binding protein YceI